MKINRLFLVLTLCCAFVTSCSDDETIVVFDEEEPLMPPSNSNDMINDLIQPVEYEMSFPYSLSHNLGYSESDYYTLEGKGNVILKHRIYPFYVYEDENANGDYYVFQSEVIVDNVDMFKGLNSYHYSDDKYKADINISGYYLKDVKTEYELLDEEGFVMGSFPMGHVPTPLTTIGSSTYKSGFKFSISGKIRIGITPRDSTYVGMIKSTPFKLSIGYDNKVIRNFDYLEVRNHSTDNTAIYDFHITRCPADNKGEGAFTPYDPALISITTNLHSQEWVWRVPYTRDHDGDDVHFKVRQKVELIYGAAMSQYSIKTPGFRHTITEETFSIVKEAMFDITPPCRYPMGTVKIVNKNKNMYIKDIKIIKEGANFASAVSTGSLAFNGSFERTLDEGRYKISFAMGRKGNDVKTYTSDGYIVISKNKSLTLYSNFDFEPDE